MNDVLQEFLDAFVMVFLDDVLVYSRDLQEHENHLRQVLTKLREHKLYAKASECTFAMEEVEFLGQKVTPRGMSPQDEKLLAVRDWQRPSDVKDVRAFLGFANYYRRYVYKYEEIVAPLTQLTNIILAIGGLLNGKVSWS